jgi:hypothetical protein
MTGASRDACPGPVGRCVCWGSSPRTFFEAEQPAEDRLPAIHHELPDAGSRWPKALSLPFGQLDFSDAELSRELLRPQIIGQDPFRWSGANVPIVQQCAQDPFEQGALALESF